jgi:aspartyl/glutamyl-tRNA(Asn/Gln) amidotransferase C subunit
MSDAELKRLAYLAHLEIPAEQVQRVRADVSSVLSAARAMQQLDIPAQAEAAPAFDEAAADRRASELRADKVTEGGSIASAESVLSHAAVREGPYFAVPKVIDGDDA